MSDTAAPVKPHGVAVPDRRGQVPESVIGHIGALERTRSPNRRYATFRATGAGQNRRADHTCCGPVSNESGVRTLTRR